MTESFSAVLAQALVDRGLTQAALARRVPCSQPTIARYLAGHRIGPTREMLSAIVAALEDVTPLEERRLYHALGYATPAELKSDVVLIDPPDLAALERERIPAGLV